MHSSKGIIGSRSGFLKGNRIVLALTGSVAVVKAFELARELMREGAEVVAAMSPAALDLMSGKMMHYATGEKIVSELTGEVEHVNLLGVGGSADMLLIAPCTANTISKIAQGVDDTVVTTMATTAIGSGRPVVVVPAMHESMYAHPIVKENIEKLKSIGVEFVNPKEEEGKAKFPAIEEIVLRIERILGPGALKGKKVLISGGATWEHIDPVRVLTNRASGKTGRELARQAYRMGADVVLVQKGKVENCIANVYVETAGEMEKAVLSEIGKGADIFISSAAVGDFSVENSESKIRSDGKVGLVLRPNEKIIRKVRERFPKLFIVGFKAEAGIGEKAVEEVAMRKAAEDRLDLVVGNDVSVKGMGTEDNSVVIVDCKRVLARISGHKRVIAEGLVELAAGVAARKLEAKERL